MEKQPLETYVHETWTAALTSWNHPDIPYVITARTQEDIKQLGQIGSHLQRELAFMKFPEFQVYANLENIAQAFAENPQRGLQAVLTHEQGHRYCPFDLVTLILLNHAAKKGLQGQTIPYSVDHAAPILTNLFTDMSINTFKTRSGNQDILWAYQQLSKAKKEKLWRVYARSMEFAWNTPLLPEGTQLSQEETDAAQELAKLFEKDVWDKSVWQEKMKSYAAIMGKFLENEKKDRTSAWDNVAGNIPQQIDEKTVEELAKRLAERGSDGLPTPSAGLKEFKEIMAGFGQGDPQQASITFYEMLSRAYDVTFATKPFGRPRTSPYQPEKWQPSMGAEQIDIDYSIQLGGKLIPGITTYGWKSRKREIVGGIEEVVPNLEIYLDSSGSMPNPKEEMSLPVLAGFVAAKKAHRKGAQVRAINFSGENQRQTQEWTRDLQSIYRVLTTHYNGGTVFPGKEIVEGRGDPKQVLVITDTFLANMDEASAAIAEFRKRNEGNKVTIYAINPIVQVDQLKDAGAEVIQGTTTEIFKRAIGKAHEVYAK